MKTSYMKIYGATLRELGARLGVSHQVIANWHKRGALREILATGRKPRYNCHYRRLLGYSLKELAAQRGCSIYKVWLAEKRRIASSRRAEEARKITSCVTEPASQTLQEVRAGNYIAAQK